MQTFRVKLEISPHSTNYTAMLFSPDGRYIAVRGKDFVLLDTTGGATRMLPELKNVYGGFAFLKDETLAYLVFGDGIHVLDLATNHVRQCQIAKLHPHSVTAVPGADVIFVSTHGGENTQVHLFGVADLEERTAFVANTNSSDRNDRLVISADGKWIAGKSWFTLRAWNVGGPKLPTRASRSEKTKIPVCDLALSPDGSFLVGAGSTGVSIWSTSGNDAIQSGKHRRTVKAVACNPTRPIFVTGDNAGQVFLWDYSGNILTRYNWELGEICGLCFAPDGLRCAAVAKTGKVVVWDVDV